MKKLILALLAAATFAAPLALPSNAIAHDRGGRDWHDDGGRDHHRGRGRGRGDWNDDHRGRGRGDWDGHRGRRHDRWDLRRHNGYWHNSRWYYGPPPRYSDAYRYDYRAWRHGDRLPAYYRNYYRPIDYGYYRLRPPPRGCHYVRDDRGEILLVAVATGVILSVIANNY